MTLVMALSLSATAFAAEPSNIITEDSAATSVSEEDSTRALGNIIAIGTTTISGGSGSLAVNLSSGNFFADIVAQIDYTPQDSLVTVYVITPKGDRISLGDIYGSGSRTYSYELTYAPAGTYTFWFFSTISSNFEVTGFIYD